jgi:integrase
MPRGAAVVEYDGKRGRVYRIKYVDAAGKQIQETVGAERDGVTRKQAAAALQDRLSDVRRRGYRRPERLTFTEWVDRWYAEGPVRRAWKPTTVAQYKSVTRLFKDHFGPQPLDGIRPKDIADYIREAMQTYTAKTVQQHVNILSGIFSSALAEELIDRNPVAGVERPKVRRRRWRILTPSEVGRVARAFTDERARVAYLTLILTGLRRFELQALRWGDVNLLEGVLRVAVSKSEERRAEHRVARHARQRARDLLRGGALQRRRRLCPRAP